MPHTDIQLRNAEMDLQTDVKLAKLLNIDKGINQLHCTWHGLQFYGQELIAWLTVFYKLTSISIELHSLLKDKAPPQPAIVSNNL